jgi:hypothetical protein
MREDKKKQNDLEHQLKVGGEGPGARDKIFNKRIQVAALDLQVSRFDQERRVREAFLLVSRLKPIFCRSILTWPTRLRSWTATIHATRNWKLKWMVSVGQGSN